MQPLPSDPAPSFAVFPASPAPFPAAPAPYPVDPASAAMTSQHVLVKQPFNATYLVPAAPEAATPPAADATVLSAEADRDHCNAPYDANTERWRTFAIVASCFQVGITALTVAFWLPTLLSGGVFSVLYNTGVLIVSALALHGCVKRRWRQILPAAILWSFTTALTIIVLSAFSVFFGVVSCVASDTDNGTDNVCNILRYSVLLIFGIALLLTCMFVPAIYCQFKYITALRATECPSGTFTAMVPMTPIATAPHNAA